MNRISFLAFAVAALAAVCGTSCQKKDAKGAGAASAGDDKVAKVEVATAASRTVDQTKTYTANIEAVNTNNITPASANRIETIAVREGDRVRRGQVLATLDASALDQLKVRLDDARREYDRAVKLLEIGGGTQKQVDQLKTELDAASSQYANARQNTILTSPIAGVVTARNYDPGDMVSMGTPILTVGQLSPQVKAMINVTENDLSRVRVGLPVTVTFDAFPGEEFPAKVSRLYPTVDPQTRTFVAEVAIANPGEKIIPGMFGRVAATLGTEDHVVVPDRAIVKMPGSGNRYVYVYSGGRVSYNRVELGQRLGAEYELLSGVQDGDTVVVAGQSRLADGARASIIAPKTSDR